MVTLHRSFAAFLVIGELFLLNAAATASIADAQSAPTLCSQTPQPRALLAGDSWAQFMWDDNLHNDLFDKFGHADKRMLSLSSPTFEDYVVDAYAVSGSEARHWVDTAQYPFQSNLNQALRDNPTVDTVVLSIGGNDLLDDVDSANPLDGGWYRTMDPQTEADLFNSVIENTAQIISNTRSTRSVDILLSSYDWPNFSVEGIGCAGYACPKREEMSGDGPLLTDAEINQLLMLPSEQLRQTFAESQPFIVYDNSVGLSHYYFGDGVAGAGELPYPQRTFPYAPGGNGDRPTLRPNFRPVQFELFPGFFIPIDGDPLHLTAHAYRYKIANQIENFFLPRWRDSPQLTLHSQGNQRDGWSDGSSFGTDAIRIGDNGTALISGIISFDTATIPDGALLTQASLYLIRDSGGDGANPFSGGQLGLAVVDIKGGHFGASADIEVGDAIAPADVIDAGCPIGTAKAEHYALRIDIKPEALDEINAAGLTQFRITFTQVDPGIDLVHFKDGDSDMLQGEARYQETSVYYNSSNHRLTSLIHQGIAEQLQSATPILDISYATPTAVTVSRVGTLATRPLLPLLIVLLLLVWTWCRALHLRA